jgi:tetratricopeptide (TPR) repeat protein
VRTRLGDTDGAVAHAERLAETCPDDWYAAFLLGDWYRRAGRMREARECFEKVLRTAGCRAWGLLGLAEVEAAQGLLPAAEGRLREALDEDPDFYEALRLLEDLHRRRARRRG